MPGYDQIIDFSTGDEKVMTDRCPTSAERGRKERIIPSGEGPLILGVLAVSASTLFRGLDGLDLDEPLPIVRPHERD